MLFEMNIRVCTNRCHVAKCPVRSPVDNWTKCKEKKDDCIQKHRFLSDVIIRQKGSNCSLNLKCLISYFNVR